jgi:hypothetical protein
VRTYTHRRGSLTISVRRLKRGLTLPPARIWMWHRCLRCPRDQNGLPPFSKRVVMSDAAANLSFGKFLELTFSNHVAASRLASCGHSIHRDCLRFYGCEGMIACFRYAPILLHTVHLPDPRLEFNNPNQQQWLKDEVRDVADKVKKQPRAWCRCSFESGDVLRTGPAYPDLHSTQEVVCRLEQRSRIAKCFLESVISSEESLSLAPDVKSEE